MRSTTRSASCLLLPKMLIRARVSIDRTAECFFKGVHHAWSSLSLQFPLVSVHGVRGYLQNHAETDNEIEDSVPAHIFEATVAEDAFGEWHDRSRQERQHRDHGFIPLQTVGFLHPTRHCGSEIDPSVGVRKRIHISNARTAKQLDCGRVENEMQLRTKLESHSVAANENDGEGRQNEIIENPALLQR